MGEHACRGRRIIVTGAPFGVASRVESARLSFPRKNLVVFLSMQVLVLLVLEEAKPVSRDPGVKKLTVGQPCENTSRNKSCAVTS
mgnify:CR=1 FL=1